MLLNLLKKKFYFEWIKEQQRALEDVKEISSFALVLKFLNFTKPFEIHKNVSDFLIEAIFMQEGHPIAFENKKLCGAQLYPIHEIVVCHGVLLQDFATLRGDT